MEVKVTNWKISTLLKRRDKINEQPDYQRGKVWSAEKEALLIDSILRGIDIPKIYLRNITNRLHDYEVADGQQRLTAIFNFYDGQFKLLDKSIKGFKVSKIGDLYIGNKRYEDLDKKLKQKFLDTEITIAVIDDCTEDEVRVLFGRLQEGVTLNAAEKRNAIISNVGKHIDSLALNHKFFENCKISKQRFKHQDYLAHVFCLIYYKNNEDLKGNLIERLYLDKSISVTSDDLKKIDEILDIIHTLDLLEGKRIINKYTFIDIFWFLYRNLNGSHLDSKSFKKTFNEFEEKRLGQKDNLKELAQQRTKESINLHSYIVNYDRSGSLSSSINVRANVFDSIFKKFIKSL
ncbi:DUF262 domain-containing protein [Parapedobacter koreensis]|uniref:GmrSD restriction endonucleases N-terminal domain-containing protein n=1 Tax=Parapedobacter koreensis TaxID=332977 RepID=A0A1H7Q0N6_9SPHI|nr:DUF262 domain-containing protein [Parapedobacter koreensis]SEL41369.1 Protein of unknown function DUF262 [Parapedobacter koreensis]